MSILSNNPIPTIQDKFLLSCYIGGAQNMIGYETLEGHEWGKYRYFAHRIIDVVADWVADMLDPDSLKPIFDAFVIDPDKYEVDVSETRGVTVIRYARPGSDYHSNLIKVCLRPKD